MLEQAIFTSARTMRQAGYQLVAASAGVSEQERRELAAWGPTHNSLYLLGSEPRSVNFQRLTSGRLVVSRTVNSGGEYSGRTGERIYTQYFVTDDEVLDRFANDPFALLFAVESLGHAPVLDEVPASLPTIDLFECATMLPREAWEPREEVFSTEQFDDLLRLVVAHPAIGLALDGDAEYIVRGLIQLLPSPLRSELSFSTGLVYSPRRPVRLQILPGPDTVEHRRFARLSGARVVQRSSVVRTV